jgi:general secretion pathway protein H
MNRPGTSDGFSLLEMLVALAVLSLAAGIAFNGTPWRKPRETLNTLSQKIVHSAAAASLRAISTGETASLKVNIVSRLVSGGLDGGIAVPERFKLSLLTGAELVRQGHIGVIEFYSDGTSSGGEIVLEENSGRSSSVRIYWLTGVISVKRSAAP